MGETRIEWADRVWNPVTGCTPVSAGCDNCYARRMANRLRGRFGYPADEPFGVTVHPERFAEPMRWRNPARIFVCSMGDLFHEDVPTKTIRNLFAFMDYLPHHTFCILTKRPRRMAEIVTEFAVEDGGNPLRNVWLGVSVEDQRAADERIPILLGTPAALRFVSVEPMLYLVDLRYLQPGDLSTEVDALAGTHGVLRPHRGRCPGLDWVICGGETGPGARQMHPEWARSLRDQCQAAGVPFFFKGWSTARMPLRLKKRWTTTTIPGPGGRELDGRTWDQFPEVKG
jgi:protein gp37